MSTADAGLIFGGFAVTTGLLGTFLGGWMADYFEKQKRVADAGLWVSGITLLAAAPVVALSLLVDNLQLTYMLLFLGMLLLFFNTGPMNALLVSCLPASIRATGVALNVLFIHLLGDAISPELVSIPLVLAPMSLTPSMRGGKPSGFLGGIWRCSGTGAYDGGTRHHCIRGSTLVGKEFSGQGGSSH